MSVMVIDMDMPIGCIVCTFCRFGGDGNMWCDRMKRVVTRGYKRLADCPLREVTDAEKCPHYIRNAHDRGDDSLCRKWVCEAASLPCWIPVTERMPEHEYGEGTSVLTVDLYGVMRVAYFDGGNWCHPNGDALTTTRVAPVTYWMPLPEPPKEEV